MSQTFLFFLFHVAILLKRQRLDTYASKAACLTAVFTKIYALYIRLDGCYNNKYLTRVEYGEKP